jgi:hypothetical protein
MRARRGTRRLAALVAVIPLCSLACKERQTSGTNIAPERPALGAVTVKPIPTVDFRGRELHLDEALLALKVKGVLERAEIFAAARPKQVVVAVGLEVRPFTEGSSEALEIGVKLRLRMTVRPEGAVPARFGEDVAAVGQAPLETRDVTEAKSAFDRLVARTAEDLVLAYVSRQKLWSADAKGIASALGASDNDLRVEAMRIIGARKLREQVPTLLRSLEDDDEGVRDAALGALVALQERGAIKALAQSRPMRDTREMRKILDAIASLGGSEAKDYLGFVADTHDDEEIRGMAREALQRLSKRTESDRPTK